MSRASRAASWGAALSLALTLPCAVLAQEETRSVPAPPPGAGTIEGSVVRANGEAAVAGLPIALYSLSPDGSPGLTGTETDASGAFRFEGLSSGTDIVYLIGVQYMDIPFGRRVRFEPGQERIELSIEVSDPLADTSVVRAVEAAIRVQWIGTRILLQESHGLESAGDTVVYVPPEAREGASPAFEGLLPEGAADFTTGMTTFSEGLVQDGRKLSFWGPVYPGNQELRFQYTVPAEETEGDAPLSIAKSLPRGAEHLVVLTPVGGPAVSVPGLAPAEDVELDGVTWRALEGHGLAAGSELSIALRLPETRSDPDDLEISRAVVWLELDDAALVVTQELVLSLDGTASLAGTGQAPLLELELPEDAELLGFSPNALSLGVSRRASGGGVQLSGPVPAGESHLSLRYRLPASSDGHELTLAFPRDVPVLDVRVADTGLVIESDRLHRLRPTKSGTRIYLLRQAFHVDAGEEIRISLSPLRRADVPRAVAAALVLAGAVAAALFVVSPLRSRTRSDGPREPIDSATASGERAGIYQTIRDLDHDFETGKVAEDDYHDMRRELRARAVSLLKEERSIATPVGSAPGVCPDCGSEREPGWRFCAKCGAPLEAPGADAPEPPA